jgi:hypothetical protein
LAVAAGLLLLVVDLGPAPAPAAPAPTFAQSLDHYYALRGRTLVFADVEGTWQATGRRVRARFEILNAAGESLILLDRYTGQVFSAGRGGEDNVYLNSIRVVQGASASIRPVELHLQGELLGEAASILYQMQQEPGVQHIYVSGDLILSPPAAGTPWPLQADYDQLGLRHIEALGDGHFRLSYLTAAELIALAEVPVQTADLVLVATYAQPATGPTATPLPPLPAGEVEP